MKKLKPLAAIKLYFFPEITMKEYVTELKGLKQKDIDELAKLAAKELGVELDKSNII